MIKDNAISSVLIGSLVLCYSYTTLAGPCVEKTTATPPFYISTSSTAQQEELQLNKQLVQTEGEGKLSGQALLDDPAGAPKRARFVERGSLVQILSDGDEVKDEQALVPVRMISPASPRIASWRHAERVKKGDTGFLDRSVLKEAGEGRVFIVQKDAVLATFPGMNEGILKAGSAIKPAMKDGKYRILECQAEGEVKPSISYIFESIPPKYGRGRNVAAKNLVALSSDFHCLEVAAIFDDQLKSLMKLSDTISELYREKEPTPLNELEVNDWGLVRLPTRATHDGSDITEVSHDGSFVHYQGPDPVGSDTWMNPHSACALMRISKEWKEKACPMEQKERCTLQIGDISFATPAHVKGDRRDPLGHLFHSTGECIDMRIFRKDGKFEGLNLTKDPAMYDSELTKKFIKFLISKRATPIYFNDSSTYLDPKLGNGNQQCNLDDPKIDRGNKVQPCPGHDNHIHFCLLPDETEGC
jgi:hypothetical protein